MEATTVRAVKLSHFLQSTFAAAAALEGAVLLVVLALINLLLTKCLA